MAQIAYYSVSLVSARPSLPPSIQQDHSSCLQSTPYSILTASGCAGMTSFVKRCEEVVASGKDQGNVNVIDGVVVGVQLLHALVNSKMGTAKGGLYQSSAEGRLARGQEWL